MARLVRTGKELKNALTVLGSKYTREQITLILKKLSIDGFRELVIRSAADTGFLRSNWSVTTAGAPNQKLKDHGGGAHNDAGYPNIGIQAGDTVTLYNNTEYAMHLETGTSNMSAQPMVEPTYQMLLNEANKLTDAASKKRPEK